MPDATSAHRHETLYMGATTCDFAPAFRDTDPEVLAMVRSCYAADPDEQTPWLVLADLLQERGDSREAWVRAGVAMWSAAASLEVPTSAPAWDHEKCRAALAPVCKTVTGWRVAGMWGCLVAWHPPTGDGSGRVMGRTWVDERVRVVQRSLWLWSLGFLEANPVDGAAWRQAHAAGRQADAAGNQADAAGRQAYAAGRQSDAAWRQAHAAWNQADAAGRQADAAGRQAHAAWRQAYAAWNQADAAGRQEDTWKFARLCWVDVCAPQLNALKS